VRGNGTLLGSLRLVFIEHEFGWRAQYGWMRICTVTVKMMYSLRLTVS
jgi:hypothetical protein